MSKFRNFKPKVGQLSPVRRRFMDWVRTHVQFGTVENLYVQKGEPVLDLQPHVYEDIKVNTEVVSRLAHLRDEEAVPQNWLNFFKQLDGIGQGMITRIDIADSQPVKMKIKKSPNVPQWMWQ